MRNAEASKQLSLGSLHLSKCLPSFIIVSRQVNHLVVGGFAFYYRDT